MRTSIGGTWLMGIMLVFIFLFSAFIILTINYSKTIRVKNEMVNFIEKYEGLNDDSISLINNYLTSNGYMAMGVCTRTNERGVYGGLSLTSNQLEKARPNVKYYYCIKKYTGAKKTNYYQVISFYKFNLPIIGDASGFTVRGTTANFTSHDYSTCNEVVGD